MVAPILPLVGAVVTQLRFDFAVTVSFDAKFDLRLETEFRLVTPEGRTQSFDPGSDLARMGSLLTLHQVAVTAAETDETGNLRLAFADNRAIEASPDAAYEAWGFTGEGGLQYICLPGGGLAIWTAMTD